MDPERAEIVAKIDEVLRTLSGPLTDDDEIHGWTTENREIASRTLSRLKLRLEDSRPLRVSEVRPSLARDFDEVGVDGGCLLDDIAVIDNEVNALVGRG